jgi:endoglucanase
LHKHLAMKEEAMARHRALARVQLASAVSLIMLLTIIGTGAPIAAAAEPGELVVNGSFDGGTAPWWWTGNLSPAVVDGQLCAQVPAGTVNPWDAIIGQNDIALVEGSSYSFSFFASGDPAGPVRALVQQPVDPFTSFITLNQVVVPGGAIYQGTFTAPVTMPDAQVAFQVGGSAESWSLCLDDVSLLGGVEPPQYEPDTGPRVRVNQVGYLPFGPKRATLVTDAVDPLEWALEDAGGAVVAFGTTTPRGLDPSSAQNVHTIDFSSYTVAGDGYTLVADSEESYPFSIGSSRYEDLRIDALEYYYPARSGIAIDGAIAGPAYARPAGHVSVASGADINQGDLAVPCQPASESLVVYGEPWTCDYTLDVVGGWYDAGDHGKYVVNGGISVYQLLSTFERTKVAASADLGALGDGSLAIPEAGNGVPDVLDEARWELEFMLSMMVPEGEELAGMVHHKIHDFGWTGLPLMPHLDPQLRYLHRPSTAATLNLAAVAAQGARLWAPYDEDFADELLVKARIAWTAANLHPDLFAPAADGANGGGPYDDDDVSDEFYWAAAELYLTTGEAVYRRAVVGSPHHTGDVFDVAGFDWRTMAPLARLDLATIPNNLSDRSRVRQSVIDAADEMVALQDAQAYGHPYAGDEGEYVWGSNSQILNNMVVIATAYDLTGNAVYRDAVVEGMDYILGRNALNNSYVTGYGDVFSQNQHSRWYAAQLNPGLPHPPDGSIAGGPNSLEGTWDPTIQRLYPEADCAPQFCYVDDIESWSTNEITINWNSTLSWVASFLADQEEGDNPPLPGCKVTYRTFGSSAGEVTALIQIRNTSSMSISNWSLIFDFLGDQTVERSSNVRFSQAGSQVTLTPRSGQSTIGPRQSVEVGLVIAIGDLANSAPELFRLNGQACLTG